jgi:hypothetical protein
MHLAGGFSLSLPILTDGSRASARLSAMKPPPATENVQTNSNTKRKLAAVARDDDGDGDGEEPPSKRAKDREDTPQSGGDSGEGVTGSSKPKARGLSQKHPVNVQNGIYAAERLSCSFDVTHSINFILLGETQDLMFLIR